ncbi:hypothetical protein A1F94_006922 [Pyrenophora tritici-repentis]|nr:hypothetical protein A1F94_010227 [Pyrenophora tritici-repentis]KAG9383001.1 hypothetical protein A1F94_006922 [Pyrenophora tritici-repentis]
MATIQTQRDATVILTDSSNWIPWYRQLKLKCQSQGIWPLLDPEGVRLQRIQPEAPLPPDISQYEPSSSPSAASSHTTRNARGNTRGSAQDTTEMSTTTSRIPTIPTRVSELSEKGQEAYKEDRDDYKLRLESYKIRERDYQEESNKISKMVEHILTTVTPHLQLSCCAENGTPRDWITALQDTVGVDEDEERARAREIPSRTQANAFNHKLGDVAEVMQTQAVIDDFLGSVSKWHQPGPQGSKGQDGREISRIDEGTMKAAFSASQQGYPLKDAFILDSGSTTHICNDLSRIEDVRPSTPGDYIWAGSSKVWIRGYGAVTLTTEGSQDKQALHIVNVAWCPDFLCSLVSFRLLRRQGIWWDNREDPTSLRRWDGTIIAILSERHGQWIIEDTTPFDSAFHVQEIATWVRTVELPGTQSQQPETETFYEDDTTQEESPRTQKTRYHQGRKVVEAYLTPPPTPPPVALLVQGEVNNEDMTNMSNQSTSMTNPWAAAFMAGTESGHIESPLKEAELEKLQEHLEGLYM